MDFGNVLRPKAAKLLTCEMCGGPIPKGEVHVKYTGKFEGDWQNWRAHDECEKAWHADGGGEFEAYGARMPERVRLLLDAMEFDRTQRAEQIVNDLIRKADARFSPRALAVQIIRKFLPLREATK